MSQQDTTAVVVSGAGRYADPWHDFEGTSAVLATQLHALSIHTQVLVAGEAEPPAGTVDLIVVNAGGGSTPTPVSDTEEDVRARALRDWVLAAVGRGVPVLATHTGSNAFYEDDRWARALGGRWVPKQTGHPRPSWHPPRGRATVAVPETGHPITAGLPAELAIDDERYSDLEVHEDSVVLLEHTEDGVRHSMSWAAESVPGLRGRAVYDGLGHDVTACREPARITMLTRELDWLLG
ncbi:ThuA domain-containing protein [Ruania halotolerans]|uniref:ThuA domain-containing protein n=1 Tax=Ruania halotolerans TaxID=2897773 RepID=UPI001E5C2E94|nr:ThuA domain-containing protein [Ruania halotolerans]UFU07842.1 ThuA domain-containing protein [Ruania halotolerans]